MSRLRDKQVIAAVPDCQSKRQNRITLLRTLLSRPTKSCCVGQKTVPTKYAEMMRCFCHKTPFFALQMMTSELRTFAQDLPIFDGLIYWVIIFNQLYCASKIDHNFECAMSLRPLKLNDWEWTIDRSDRSYNWANEQLTQLLNEKLGEQLST